MDIVVLIGLFVEGLLSFLSPCILPLVPLYVSYLSQTVQDTKHRQAKIMILTNCFVLGICSVFFVMALGASSLRVFIQAYQVQISIFGGIVLVIFGLINFGIFGKLMTKTYKLEAIKHSNPYINAYLIGFFFSFGWTPCIGPYLSNVIIQASTSSMWIGNVSILAYALGFVIPFLFIGLFTDLALKLIKNNLNILKWTAKIGAVVLIVMGVWMTLSGIEKLDYQGPNTNQEEKTQAYDFSVEDQYGNIRSASDYLGKKTVMQFMTTWCKYCKESIDVLEAYAKSHPDVNVIFVMAPGSANEMNKDDLIQYIKDHEFELTVLLDEDYSIFRFYGINSFPTTFYLNEDGYVMGYTQGLLPESKIIEIVDGL